jgi:tetraacyldisaccharide 4'-kinase
LVSSLYSVLARSRRNYFAADPLRRRRLSRPVISVGNLSVGGRGKTPLTAAIAAFLRDSGEVPAILSRGYARRRVEDGVVVVRDPGGIRADLDRAGDEPLMLARQLDGTAVLSCPDRYLAGRLAETHFGCTVHVLDDGFQHLRLHRDVDIVAVAREDVDVDRARTLPAGRLREPLDALMAADALVAVDGELVPAPSTTVPVFAARRILGSARAIDRCGEAIQPSRGAGIAVAGIARPEQFFDDLRAAGWPIARALPYPDHHAYSPRDVARILSAGQAEGADFIVTTEKDAVRLLPHRPFPIDVVYVPLRIAVEPEGEFEAWLLDALNAARRSGS